MEEDGIIRFSSLVIRYESFVVVSVFLVHECYGRSWVARRGGCVVAQLRQLLRWVRVGRVLAGTTSGDDEVGECDVEDLVRVGERGVCGACERIKTPNINERPDLA